MVGSIYQKSRQKLRRWQRLSYVLLPAKKKKKRTIFMEYFPYIFKQFLNHSELKSFFFLVKNVKTFRFFLPLLFWFIPWIFCYGSLYLKQWFKCKYNRYSWMRSHTSLSDYKLLFDVLIYFFFTICRWNVKYLIISFTSDVLIFSLSPFLIFN